MTKQVLLEVLDNHIGIITLNRPEAANSLSRQMLRELEKTIEEIKGRKDIFCTVITGSSDRVFCAGADLKERKTMNEDEVIRTLKKIGEVIKKLEMMFIPTIEALNRSDFGGGYDLAIHCVLRFSSNNISLRLVHK